jgi:hypothetical protein
MEQREILDGSETIYLFYGVNKGDVFQYKVELNQDNFENGVSTDYLDVKSYENKVYYYTKVVHSIEENGNITFKVHFDSINVHEGSSHYSTMHRFNSIYCYKNRLISPDSAAYMEYYAVIGTQFFITVSKYGEVTEAFGLQDVYNNIFKIFDDTLNTDEKTAVKEQFGSEELIDIFQNEYIMFPENGIDGNSLSWTRKNNMSVIYFESENIAKYDIGDSENGIYSIQGDLQSKLIGNEFTTEDSIKIKVKNYDSKFSGKSVFDSNIGCVKSRENSGKLTLNLELSRNDEVETSKYVIDISSKVKHLN